jgi:XTP/dITP diphosphohydrolase
MQKPVKIVIATRNQGKALEIKSLLKEFAVDMLSLSDVGPIPEVEENGKTFDENAYQKASFTARILGIPALADDSGLTVEALGGAPGVYSARYAGENATDEDRCRKLLKEMEGQNNRKAAFECVISVAVPNGVALTYEGRCDGEITRSSVGANGFGYDPVFYYPPMGKTFAEMTTEEKNQVSHRGKVFRELKNEFDKVLVWIHQQMPKK